MKTPANILSRRQRILHRAWRRKGRQLRPSRCIPTRPGFGTRGPARRLCLCDTAQGLFAPLRTSDEGLSRPYDHSSEPSSSDTMTGAFVPLRPRPVFRHRLRQRKGLDPFIIRVQPEPVLDERGCKSLSAPATQITGETP